MILEQLIFTIIAFSLFIYTFYKMIKNNEEAYTIILLVQALGISINFISVIFGIKLNIFATILMWIMSVVLPIAIIVLEKNDISFLETMHLLKAKIYFKLGKNKKAKQELINIIEKNQESYKAHKLLAIIYETEGGTRKAIDEYVQTIDINKTDYDSYYKVANLLNSLDKKNEASQMLVNLLNKRPDFLEASQLLGEIYIDKQMYKEAANVYQEALKYNITNYDLYYDLGIVYTMLNDFQNAKICYEKAAQLNSLLYNAKYSLAEIALIYKDLEEAEQRFLQVVEGEELSADAYFELSKINLIKSDKDMAIKYANVAVELGSKRIVEKIKNDPIFIPIIARISIPFNLEEENSKTNLSPKELKAKEHLEEMFEITRNLSYNDIRLLKQNRKKNENSKEYIEKDNSKERAE